jgi:hypothetical protein
LACCSNSSNRWCASSELSVPERARSVAAAKAAWGVQEREGGEVEVEEELRRRGATRDIGAVE